MTKNIFPLQTLKTWSCALVISVPVLAAQALVPAFINEYRADTVITGVAAAQEKKKEQKTKRTQAINNKVYEKLTEAQELLETKDFKGATEILDALMKNERKPLNDAEKAQTLTLYAFVYYSQENYPKALDSYKKILTLEQASEGSKAQAQFSVAQLYFVTEQYQNAVDALLAWFKVSPQVSASNYVLLAQGYYQLQKFDLALENVNRAISMYETAEPAKVPKENWYGLQRYLYYEKGNYKKVVSILDKLLQHYPKKQYWVQLSAMQAELKNDSLQLAAMETAYVQGMLDKEQEQVNMAYLFLANDVPYKAAKVLDKGIKNKSIKASSKNLELLGNSWRAAQEVKKAIPEMAKAAQKSDKGELWARLGNIYLDNDEFDKAVKAVKAGLKKGGVKRPDTANLVLGMAYFNMKQYKSARNAFNQAMKDDRSEDYAKQWINFMDRELERQRSLQEA